MIDELLNENKLNDNFEASQGQNFENTITLKKPDEIKFEDEDRRCNDLLKI